MPVEPAPKGKRLSPSSLSSIRGQLDLSKDQVTHLIRAALFEDATNASERMGAGLAEIRVDEDLDVVVSFEDHYWPEEKEPTAAIEVAAVLGIEMELEVMWSDTLFAWPGLGTVTQSTAEYTRMMLDAYRSNGIVGKAGGNQ